MRALAAAAIVVPFGLAACLHAADDENEIKRAPNQLGQQKITFASRRDGDLEIFVLNPDGTGLRQLTKNGTAGSFDADDEAPAWSPDGRLIAFVTTRHGAGDAFGVRELYVMAADGSRQRRLTDNAREEFAPGWLPDGRIAFVTCSASSEDEVPVCDLAAIRPDGRGEEMLSELGFVFDLQPSPDGTRIVYSELAGQSHFQHFELHAADLDGDDHRQLTENDAGDASPAWSPTGELIAFVSNRAQSASCFSHDCVGFTTELYVMNADGGDVTRLTETPHQEASPTWSPDGTRILYSRQLDADDDHELYVMNSDGSCPTRLLPGEWDTMPDWYGPSHAEHTPLEC